MSLINPFSTLGTRQSYGVSVGCTGIIDLVLGGDAVTFAVIGGFADGSQGTAGGDKPLEL